MLTVADEHHWPAASTPTQPADVTPYVKQPKSMKQPCKMSTHHKNANTQLTRSHHVAELHFHSNRVIQTVAAIV